MHNLSTRPKSKVLYAKLRSDILEGKLTPGQWLKQVELEKSYSASRSEVRAALSSLAEHNIVEYTENRGFRVPDRSQEEIREMVEVIITLELASAQSIVNQVTEQDLQELTELAETFANLIDNGKHADLRICNYQYHSRLNSLSSNRTMSKTIQKLRECCVVGPFNRYTTYRGLQASSEEHFSLIEALRQRDVELFRHLLTVHGSHID